MDIFAIIGKAPLPQERREDTSALRMSLAFNRLGGPHRLGTDEIHITKSYDRDSVPGRDGQQYLSRTIAYGPFLAMKYKSPQLIRTTPLDPGLPERTIRGRRGIVRFVTFHKVSKHADARIALWECNHLFEMRELSKLHHLISVEFWELSGEQIQCPYFSDRCKTDMSTCFEKTTRVHFYPFLSFSLSIPAGLSKLTSHLWSAITIPSCQCATNNIAELIVYSFNTYSQSRHFEQNIDRLANNK